MGSTLSGVATGTRRRSIPRWPRTLQCRMSASTDPNVSVSCCERRDAHVGDAARRGNHQAFTALVSHYDDRLRALAYHLLHDPEATRDALQDAYVKAYVGLSGFRGESELGTWLHRIVYTTCLNHLRSIARRPRPVGEDSDAREGRDEAGRDPADTVASALDLESLLRSLPPEQRAAVVLVAALGVSYEKTA